MGENCSHLDPFRFGTKPSTIRSMPPRERAEGTTHAAFKSCGELAFSFIIPATLIHTCLIVSLYPNKYIYIYSHNRAYNINMLLYQREYTHTLFARGTNFKRKLSRSISRDPEKKIQASHTSGLW